jgi:CheY-like chemotaxis protein
MAESEQQYDAADFDFAKELARRASIAIENIRLYRLAQEANRLKDQFLATLSHELRTPLTGILGWSRVLRSDKLDELASKNAVAAIERCAKAQAQIINDILDVSRIVNGKLHIEFRPVYLLSVVEAAIDAVRPTAEAKAIHIETEFVASANVVLADYARLQQVIWNLLHNAIKFTQNEGRIAVRLEEQDSHAVIIVSDNGQGISPEFLPHVFDRFRQADGTTTRKHGGLGLGLSLAHHLVELHGGQIYAESEGEGKGANFIVKLPIAEFDRQHDNTSSSGDYTNHTEADRPDARNLHLGGGILKDLYVLVVDDDPDTRELLANIISACGALVNTVPSVQRALQVIADSRFDILVSDIGMPGEDGYSLLRKVRELETNQGCQPVPAIALTAYARPEDRQKAISAGFNAHLTKPIDQDVLIRSLAGLAGRA